MRIDDKIRDTIVIIGGLGEGGGFSPFGTGFIVCNTIDGRAFLNIVTARHVVDDIERAFGESTACVRINDRAGEAQIVGLPVWHHHPDKKVDVSIAPTVISREVFDFRMMEVGSDLILTEEKISESDIGIGDEIFAVGMFEQHRGQKRNLPIVRGGIIAAMPEEKIKTQYGEHYAYLVETRSFDGLSGSPTFVQPQPLRYLEGNKVVASKWSHHFMGMLLGHHLVANPRDTIEILDGQDEHVDTETPMLNTGIGIVLPFYYIQEAIEQSEIYEKRMDAENRRRTKRKFIADSSQKRRRRGISTDSASPTKGENPQHREDFSRLLDAAVPGNKSDR